MMSDWAENYFERGYQQRWGLLPVTDRVRGEAGSLWRLLQVPSTARVLDLGCGNGRYALAFAERGTNVVGVDSAVMLLRQARNLGLEHRLSIRWILGDMRALPLQRGCFDAVVLVDAFGFFDAEEDNERVLAEAGRVLVPGGRLAMKVVNGERILASFRGADREEREGVVVTISRTFEREPARMIERLLVSGVRGNGEYERRQRLYRAEELLAAANRVGFSPVDVFADADGTVFEPATSRSIWIVARLGHAI